MLVDRTSESVQHPHPQELGISDFSQYGLIIDARSPREYAEDHLPGAVNLPVVDDDEFAEVGTTHKRDPHAAYLIGVPQSLRNISAHIETTIVPLDRNSNVLVYCFRGGKRSKLWADNLRTIGFKVDVLSGGWKRYRGWVRSSLDRAPTLLTFRVLSGSTGSGKTRLLHTLAGIGEQVLDLEALARHRGSLIGALPDTAQPSQKQFDSDLLVALRSFDVSKVVWVEAESKKIGNVQIPTALQLAMRRHAPITLKAAMSERVQMWLEDYPNLAADPISMVEKLEPLKPLIGSEELGEWRSLAWRGDVKQLFERVMTKHYDPAYARSTSRSFKDSPVGPSFELASLAKPWLETFALELARSNSTT